MPDQTWADAVIERRAAAIASAAKIGTRSEIQMEVARALYEMRKYYERKLAAAQGRYAAVSDALAECSEWGPVEEDEKISLRWGGEILQNESGEMTIKNARGGRNIVQLPDDVRLYRRNSSEEAPDA